MNIRILRQCQRSELKGHNSRRVVGLGQLQPVLFSIERGGPSLRIEGAVAGRACWWVLPLPKYKQEAKKLYAELEQAMRDGVPGAAKAAWETVEGRPSLRR